MIRLPLNHAGRITAVMLALLSTILISVAAQADTLAGIAVLNLPGTSTHIPVMPGQLVGQFEILDSEAELGFDPAARTSSGGTIRLSYEGQFADNGTQCLRRKTYFYTLSSGSMLSGTYTLAWTDVVIGLPFGFEGECSPTSEGQGSGSWTGRERTDDDNVGLKGNLIDILDGSNTPLAELLISAPECPDCEGNRPPVIQEWFISNETPLVGERVSILLQVFDPDPGDTLSFAWFLDGVLTGAAGDGVEYTPREPGIVKIVGEVSDPHGAKASITLDDPRCGFFFFLLMIFSPGLVCGFGLCPDRLSGSVAIS